MGVPPSPLTDDAAPEPATRLLRLAGYFADQAVLGLLLAPALYLAAVKEAQNRTGIGGFLSAFTAVTVAGVVYYAVPTAIWGRTLGKWMVGTQVIGPDGGRPGWWRAWVRAVVAFLADLLSQVGLGLVDPAWILWDPKRQALHDKAAGTVVVITRHRRPVPMLLLSLALTIASQVGLVFAVIRPFIVQAYYVPSGSMHFTLMEHDRVLVNKLSYRSGELRRGDIVVFRPPAYVTPGKREDFIKRLIGLPGDTVQVRDGRLFLNGHTVEEPYLAEPVIRYDWGPVTAPAGSVIVMGDNRNNSADAHAWMDNGRNAPFLPVARIHGRAFYRFWPLGRMGAIEPAAPAAGG